MADYICLFLTTEEEYNRKETLAAAINGASDFLAYMQNIFFAGQTLAQLWLRYNKT